MSLSEWRLDEASQDLLEFLRGLVTDYMTGLFVVFPYAGRHLIFQPVFLRKAWLDWVNSSSVWNIASMIMLRYFSKTSAEEAWIYWSEVQERKLCCWYLKRTGMPMGYLSFIIRSFINFRQLNRPSAKHYRNCRLSKSALRSCWCVLSSPNWQWVCRVKNLAVMHSEGRSFMILPLISDLIWGLTTSIADLVFDYGE